MKILMITPYLPYPLFSGGQIRSYNLLKNLSPKHEITLFSFIRRDEEKKYIDELLKFCSRVEVFKRRPAWSLTNILFAGASLYPFLVAIYYSRRLRRKIAQELTQNKYDLIHAETFYVMPNIPKTSVPRLLVEQTIEYLVYQHFVEEFKPFFLKPLLYFDVAKIKFWEKHFWRGADRVIAMSEADKTVMEKDVPSLRVDIVPNGVDAAVFARIRPEEHPIPTVLFVGNFRWLQNREAALLLVKGIWPKIKKNLGKARLWIVGRNPTQDIKNLARNDILVDESVENIEQAYKKADLLLAPLLGGGGTRFKILEAMASGLPVVTTPMGIEGITARDGQEVLIAQTPAELARAALRLLRDKPLAQEISGAARNLVCRKYGWQDIAQSLDRIYQEVGGEEH